MTIHLPEPSCEVRKHQLSFRDLRSPRRKHIPMISSLIWKYFRRKTVYLCLRRYLCSLRSEIASVSMSDNYHGKLIRLGWILILKSENFAAINQDHKMLQNEYTKLPSLEHRRAKSNAEREQFIFALMCVMKIKMNVYQNNSRTFRFVCYLLCPFLTQNVKSIKSTHVINN